MTEPKPSEQYHVKRNGQDEYDFARQRPRAFTVTLAEERLLCRLRQLAHQNPEGEVTVKLFPLSLRTLGEKEYLDPNEAHS